MATSGVRGWMRGIRWPPSSARGAVDQAGHCLLLEEKRMAVTQMNWCPPTRMPLRAPSLDATLLHSTPSSTSNSRKDDHGHDTPSRHLRLLRSGRPGAVAEESRL